MVPRKMPNDSLEDIEAVIFDLDETLIDALRGLDAAHHAVAEKICKYVSCQNLDVGVEEINENLDDFSERMNLERNYDRDLWWQKLVDEMGIGFEFSAEQSEKLTEIYWNTYSDSAIPYPDTRSVLEYLDGRGYALGLITDTDGSKFTKRERIFKFDFSKLFDTVVVGGEDTPEPKPDPGSFKLAAENLGVSTDECVMVGDKPFTDIKGANSVGMRTILIERRDWGVNEKPDYTIRHLSEIKELL